MSIFSKFIKSPQDRAKDLCTRIATYKNVSEFFDLFDPSLTSDHILMIATLLEAEIPELEDIQNKTRYREKIFHKIQASEIYPSMQAYMYCKVIQEMFENGLISGNLDITSINYKTFLDCGRISNEPNFRLLSQFFAYVMRKQEGKDMGTANYFYTKELLPMVKVPETMSSYLWNFIANKIQSEDP